MKSPRVYKPLLAALTAALLLVGCVNQQKEVAVYRAVLNGQFPAQTQPAPADQPLRLSTALALANGTSEELDIAGEDYLQALIARDKAAASFLPRVSLEPSYTRLKTFDTAGFPPTFAAVFPTHYFDLPVQTSLDVNVIEDLANVHRAGRTAEQRRALLLDLQETVLLNTCDAFYNVLVAEEEVRVLEHSLTLRNEQVESIQRKLRAGVARPLDVLQSRADAAATQVQLTDARNRVVTARATLAYMIGTSRLPAKLADDLALPAALPPLDELRQQALSQRADLHAAHRAIEAAQQAVRSAIGQYFPSVGLNFSGFLYRESFPSDSWWTAMVSANLPIFEAGIIHANVRTAFSQLRQAALGERQLERQIEEQVTIARENLIGSRQRLSDLQREQTAAEGAYQQAAHSFQVGTATNLDRLTAQDQALQAELGVARATFTQKLAFLRLARVVGALSDAVPLPDPQQVTKPITDAWMMPATTAPAGQANTTSAPGEAAPASQPAPSTGPAPAIHTVGAGPSFNSRWVTQAASLR